MITESELKTIMNMPQEYPVCKETVVGFNNYIQESYKLYKELVALHGKNFSIKVEDVTHNLKISIKNLQESQMIDYSFSYQQFVQGYSPTSMQFAIRYINPFDNRDIYFFETHFEKSIHTKIICEAYKHFVVNILQEIIDRYKTKHNIELKTWMDLSKSYNPYDRRYPIHLQGIKFLKNLGIIIPDDNYSYLSDADMTQAITNQENVWTTKMHEPIKRLITNIDSNNEK